MNLLSWIIFGVIVGIVAHSLERHGSSLLSAVVMGIGGAVVGGLLATLIFGIPIRGFDLTAFLIAAGGSLFVLSLGQAVKNS